MVIVRNPLLTAFERICILKTVHAAAIDLGLTQAAVTKRIQALEAEMGLTLFLRSRRGMALTNEGHALLQFCNTTREAEGALLGKLNGPERLEVNLTIAGPTSPMASRIAQSCIPLYSKFPFLRLHLRTDDHANLIESIRRGEADLAVVSPEQVPNEMQSKMLKPERFFLVATSDWKRRDLSSILKEERIVDFYESDTTTTTYLKTFGLEKIGGRARLFINQNDALIQYLISGVGVGTLAESVAKPHLESGQLIRLNRGQSLDLPLALAWYARSKEMTYFTELVRNIK